MSAAAASTCLPKVSLDDPDMRGRGATTHTAPMGSSCGMTGALTDPSPGVRVEIVSAHPSGPTAPLNASVAEPPSASGSHVPVASTTRSSVSAMTLPVTVGEGVSVGHGTVLHDCTVEDDVLVGMNATVMNGARIGRGSIIAAGALITENPDIPPGSLVASVPGKVRRGLTGDEMTHVRANAQSYVELMRRHAKA